MDIKKVPQSLEAEKGLIGALLIDSEKIKEISSLIMPYHFYNQINKSIYEEIINLYNEKNEKTASINSGENIRLQFLYTYSGSYKDKISFVFNLYRHDDLYICGTTTLMEGISPYMPLGREMLKYFSLELNY